MCFFECVLFSYKAGKENNLTINYKNGQRMFTSESFRENGQPVLKLY